MIIKTLWINWTFLTFTVTRGYDDLSANMIAMQYKTHISCPTCVANNAVDRNIQTCTRTADIGTTSSYKNIWWYVDLGSIYSVYNIGIQFKDYADHTNRQRGRFAGFSLYVSNTTDRRSGYLSYKDGPHLPPLDFNTTCITHGRYIIFYNERLNITYPIGYEISSVYTELCEVTVLGCSSSDVYGENCDKVCPDNCQERRCDIINGTCFGCTPGWEGARCNITCSPGYYGFKCESKCVGHCNDSAGCNHTSGLCDSGCDGGWTGSNCTKECTSGTYGPDCVYNCSGNCLGNVICNRTTGKCDTGCNFGYTGGFCEKECELGTFGKGCSNKCSGHCLKNVSCNTASGHCDSGCAPGYVEPLCNKKSESENAGQDIKTETVNIKAVTGAVGACVFLLVIVVSITYVLRQRRNRSKKADKGEEKMVFSAMDETLIKSKRKPADKNGIQNDISKSKTKERSKRFKSKDSQNLNGLTKYLSAIKSTKMEEEYKTIPKGELHSCTEGKKQENKSKNRYTTIFPYDHSRVVLSSSTTGSDYINANYIQDVFEKKKSIASQGPKESTIPDFWRMVWQENARIIVCLTNISEAKTKKCAKYWPDLNDKHMEGDISVRCQKEQSYAENVVRHLRIKNISENTERDVFMFHYIQWPDHGVPEPLSLVVFHRHVIKTAEEHPMGYIVCRNRSDRNLYSIRCLV